MTDVTDFNSEHLEKQKQRIKEATVKIIAKLADDYPDIIHEKLDQPLMNNTKPDADIAAWLKDVWRGCALTGINPYRFAPNPPLGGYSSPMRGVIATIPLLAAVCGAGYWGFKKITKTSLENALRNAIFDLQILQDAEYLSCRDDFSLENSGINIIIAELKKLRVEL